MRRFFQNSIWGDLCHDEEGDYDMRRKICLRGGRIMVWGGVQHRVSPGSV